MRRLWRPLVAGAVVVVFVFVLAQAQIFEPSATSAVPAAVGATTIDPTESALFTVTCQ